MTLAERVAIARNRLGISRSELARRTGLTPAAVWQIEHGDRTPSVPSLLKLVEALEISADWLLGLSEAAPSDPRVARMVRGWAKLSDRDREAIIRLYETLAGDEPL